MPLWNPKLRTIHSSRHKCRSVKFVVSGEGGGEGQWKVMDMHEFLPQTIYDTSRKIALVTLAVPEET